MNIVKDEDYWGTHMILNAGGCIKNRIMDADNVIQFAKELVVAIDMVAYGEPWLRHFAAHDPSKGGFTLFQPIETSAITAHFVDATGAVFLDIFSCKPFEKSVAIDTFRKYFEPRTWNVTMLARLVP